MARRLKSRRSRRLVGRHALEEDGHGASGAPVDELFRPLGAWQTQRSAGRQLMLRRFAGWETTRGQALRPRGGAMTRELADEVTA